MPPRKATRLPSLPASAQRFRQAQHELLRLDYFFKGTVLKRMMKCGQSQCACHRDPAKRHGPYFEWTYKANGKTVNVKLSPHAAPLYEPVSQFVYALKASDVGDVMVNGRVVVRDRQVLTLDMKQVMAKTAEFQAKVQASLAPTSSRK